MSLITKRRDVDCTLLENGAPTSNFSAVTQGALGWTSGGFGQKTRMILRFDLSDLDSSVLPSAATLTITNSGSGGAVGDGIYYCRRMTTTSWSERTASWNTTDGSTPWTTTGGDYTSTGQATCMIVSPTANLVFNDAAFLALVIDAIQNRSGVLTVEIMQAEAIQGDAVTVYTSADATISNRPTLQLTVAAIATPTLAVSDNGNGTGAMATIYGSSSGATNYVYVANWNGSGLSFAVGGSRTGNGTVSLPLSNGEHLAYCVSILTAQSTISNHVDFQTSGGLGVPADVANCDLISVLNAVVARLQSQVTLPDNATFLNNDTCFIWLVDGDPPPAASNVFVTVEPDGASYDESLFIGGGENQVMEETGIAVTIHSSVRLDPGNRDKEFVRHAQYGVLATYKKVLKALSGHNLLVGGAPVLREYLRPQGRGRVTRRGNDRFGEMTAVFSISFDWDLAGS